MITILRHLLAIAILPFTVTVLVPIRIAQRNGVALALGRSVGPVFLQVIGFALLTLGLVLFVASLRRSWDAQTNNTFYGNGAVFNNSGTFSKSGGAFVGSGNDYTELDGNTTFNNFGTVDNQTGLLEFLAGTSYGGSVFNTPSNSYTGFGANYMMTGDVTFTGAGSIPGALNGSNAVLHGSVSVSFMTFSGTLTFASNSVLCVSPIQPPQPISFAGTVFTNYGTVIWTNTDLYGQSSPQIYNYGLWDAQSDNTFHGAASPFTGQASGTTTFNNYGTFRKSAGSPVGTTLDNNTVFNNFGTLDVQAGWLNINNASGSGVFNTANDGRLFFLNNLTLIGNPAFTGTGLADGYFNGSNAVINGALTSPLFMGLSGTLTVASNAMINFIYQVQFNGVVLTNDGTVVWSGGDLYSGNNSQIENYGLWDAQSDDTFYGADSGGGVTTFNNYGTFRKSASAGGATTLDNNTAFNNSGTADVQTGALAVDGSYTLAGGTLNFGIAGPSNFGSVNFGANAALAGALSVNLTNGYSPVSGNAFPLLNYGSETGIFTKLNLPHLARLIWQTNYNATTFTLNVTNVPPMVLSPLTLRNGNTISFSWTTFDGQSYQVQYTTNLASANWLNLAGPIIGTNGTTTVSDNAGLCPQRFYRVVLQ